MKIQLFRRKRAWGKNSPDNTDFYTTWIIVCLCVLAIVTVLQE